MRIYCGFFIATDPFRNEGVVGELLYQKCHPNDYMNFHSCHDLLHFVLLSTHLRPLLPLPVSLINQDRVRKRAKSRKVSHNFPLRWIDNLLFLAAHISSFYLTFTHLHRDSYIGKFSVHTAHRLKCFFAP